MKENYNLFYVAASPRWSSILVLDFRICFGFLFITFPIFFKFTWVFLFHMNAFIWKNRKAIHQSMSVRLSIRKICFTLWSLLFLLLCCWPGDLLWLRDKFFFPSLTPTQIPTIPLNHIYPLTIIIHLKYFFFVIYVILLFISFFF